MAEGNSGPALEIRSIPTAAGVRLAVAGELDAASGPQFDGALRAAMRTDSSVELDLSGVTFMDSMGLRSLVYGMNNETEPATLRLVKVSEPVRRLLDLAGLRDTYHF